MSEFYLQSFPCNDEKWLRVDLVSALRSPEHVSILWNNLIKDLELTITRTRRIENIAGNVAFLTGNGKYYCGAEKVDCNCNKNCAGICHPRLNCNCKACRLIDATGSADDGPNADCNADDGIYSNLNTADEIIDSWLWCQSPSIEAKSECVKRLLREQRDLLIQVAGNSITAQHLEQILFVYRRYLIALMRVQNVKDLNKSKQICKAGPGPFLRAERRSTNNIIGDFGFAAKKPESGSFGLARVGTRAALNFSFAFLKRAWRSGEDAELCSELLLDALEALQLLPEASLFNSHDISPLWLEVLDNSIKFLRKVVVDDISDKFTVPQTDQYIALSLLIELAIQKGTLSASLEAIILLLTLADKEKEKDNRTPPSVQNVAAPLLSILRRYENISGDQSIIEKKDESDGSTTMAASPTESFLRFLSLADNEAGNIDLKKSAVIIISHLDRLVQPHLPSIEPEDNNRYKSTKMYTLGLVPGSLMNNGITNLSANDALCGETLCDWPNTSIVIKKMCCTRDNIVLLCDIGNVYTFASNRSHKLSPDTSSIKKLDGFGSSIVLDIQAHCEGYHFLALTADHHIFAWGNGEDGCLGFGDTISRKTPTKLLTLADKFVTKIYCGIASSAAITITGELYTWGHGINGNLGHASNDDKLTPSLVEALIGYPICDIALGHIDFTTLCVTDSGTVFAWGGFCGATQTPMQLIGVPIVSRIFSTTRIFIAMMHDGSVYEWPRKYIERLCIDFNAYAKKKMANSDDFESMPKRLNVFDGKKVIDLAIGSAHCVILTNTGELYGWGRNDFKQIAKISDKYLASPIKMPLPNIHIKGLVCGATSTIIFSNSPKMGLCTQEQYIVDLSETTFTYLDKLLTIVSYSGNVAKTGANTASEIRPPPSQELECIYVAALNLLCLQLYAMHLNGTDARTVGLSEGSPLLISLKTRIIALSGTTNILKTIQDAAQWTLKIGWSILLPSATERAQTLTTLLQSESGTSSPQYSFMTNLLVGSLMADDNLQIALRQAIKSDPDKCVQTHSLPILHLVNQLLSNNTVLTQANLNQITANGQKLNDSQPIRSPGINLLHRFQRLLFSYAYNLEGEDLAGAESLLEQYIQNVVSLCVNTLTKAYDIATMYNCKEFVASILSNDNITDTLLYELLLGLVLLHCDKQTLILQNLDWNATFMPLIMILDNLNRTILDVDTQDTDDLSWPGIVCRGTARIINNAENDVLIRKDDLENNILDGGCWIILNGDVYDVKDFRSDSLSTNEIIAKGIGKDLTNELNTGQHAKVLTYIINHLKVGRLFVEELYEKKELPQQTKYGLTHLQSEKTISFLTGLRACRKQKASNLQPAEMQCKDLLNSPVFGGGLQMLQPTNPFDEEKADARSCASTNSNTPTEVSNKLIESGIVPKNSWLQAHLLQRIEYFLNGLADCRMHDPAIGAWFTISERYCKENNLIWHQDFPIDHPISELGRLLVAVIIRHQCLGPLVLDTVDHEITGTISEPIPKVIIDVIKTVYDAKWTLIKTRQQLNRSYKEVCAPMLEKCRFLLYEVRPAISPEQYALKHLNILYKPQRFKTVVRRIIYKLRAAKKVIDCAKPDDVFNVNKQNRNPGGRLHLTDSLTQPNSDSDMIGTHGDHHVELASLDDPSLSDSVNAGDNNILIEKNLLTFDADYCDETKDMHLCDFRKDGSKDDDDQFIQNALKILQQKNLNLLKNQNVSDDLNVGHITAMIVDFVIESTCDVETIRRAMYCQRQRYQTRKQGIQLFSNMCTLTNLIDAVQYSLLSGYLGLFLSRDKQHYASTVLSDLNMITCSQKADLIIEHSKLIEWAILNQRQNVNCFSKQSPLATMPDKNNSNIGTYVFLKKLPKARFLLNVLGILSKNIEPNEISFIINSGVIGCILSLLRQTGADLEAHKIKYECTYVCEDTTIKKCKIVNLSGPDLIKLMKIGTRVARGADWKWGDQDGASGIGRIISEVGEDGWVRVEWDTGATNSYRMGRESQYDLRLAENVSVIDSPDTETEDKTSQIEVRTTANSHPTKLLKTVSIKLLQLLAITTSIHGDKIEKSALFNMTGMFRYLLESKSNLVRLGLQKMSIFAMLRSLAQPQNLAILLTAPCWMKLYLRIINGAIGNEYDFHRKIQCIRLLKVNLTFWSKQQLEFVEQTIGALFTAMGHIAVCCPNDTSLLHNKANFKSKELISASHSGTIVEELISLLRKLHDFPLWNKPINTFIEQKICLIADIFSQRCENDRTTFMNLCNFVSETEKSLIIAALLTIGGYDPRPRIGLRLKNNESNKLDGTITSFTPKGKVEVTLDNEPTEYIQTKKKISMNIANVATDFTQFNLKYMPLNEVLLNSLMLLLAGPPEWKNIAINGVNTSLLRAQQLHFSALNATTKLFSHQNLLRKILQQRCPHETCSVPDKDGNKKLRQDNGLFGNDLWKEMCDSPETENEDNALIGGDDLLFQSMLSRAIRPNPLKTMYTYDELLLAAVNILQDLSAHIYVNSGTGGATRKTTFDDGPKFNQQILQPTMVHGVPIYNNPMGANRPHPPQLWRTEETRQIKFTDTASGITQPPITDADMNIALHMGFSEKDVKIAVRALKLQGKLIIIDNIIEWIVEHTVECRRNAAIADTVDSDMDSVCSIDTTTNDDGHSNSAPIKKYLTCNDFKNHDQYALYVRGHVKKGMLVKCCKDFEEITCGDIGNVLQVDTEGLHDLNVQVDWRIHAANYWMRFIHIEIIDQEKIQPKYDFASISVGSNVRINRVRGGDATQNSNNDLTTGDDVVVVGIVASIQDDGEVTVDIASQYTWSGKIYDLEPVAQQMGALSMGNEMTSEERETGDIIEDWSQCLQSLTVSSNETRARYLLDKTPNYWQSNSTHNIGPGKHWIRLQIHENILIHTLSITVNGSDGSHMPSLIIIRVGDSVDTLKDYSWVSVKQTDVHILLLSEIKEYYPWIEIVIKQCHSNGIQCKIHGIDVVGRLKQTDLDKMLMNASFMVKENELFNEAIVSSPQYYDDAPSNDNQCKVYVWGLNDKEQLAGVKGSKVKCPVYSSALSQLKPVHIAGGSKSLFIVSHDGKVYACGEGTNGRLGLGNNCNVSTPRQLPVLNQFIVKKVTVHSGGKHAMALTLDGKVFSWGEGEDGKLGHSDRITLNKPKLIEALRHKRIRDIACGSSHSAAIASGELYTWGLGEYGRLGHGDNVSQLKPKRVEALVGHRIVQVSCGSRDAQTLALSDEGLVFSWGDGDFGKLGRGGSEGCLIPQQVEKLNNVGIIQIECGAQFSLALTESGEVWTWGKGDYYRLGHGTDQHVRKPTQIQSLRGKKIVHVAVGALHCLAVTDTGHVYAFGDNDHGQQGTGTTTVNKKPCGVIGLDKIFVNRVACGSSHSVAWSLPQPSTDEKKNEPVLFPAAKDPLGGISLGIYDSEIQYEIALGKSDSRASLSETVLSLHSPAAKQKALAYILNAISILQARQCIIAALTSHSEVSKCPLKKLSNICISELDTIKEATLKPTANEHHGPAIDMIANDGGEGLIDFTAFRNADSPELSTPDQSIPIVPNELTAFHSINNSMSASLSSGHNVPQKHKKLSTSVLSVMTAIISQNEEPLDDNVIADLDDFILLLKEPEVKSLIELLKLIINNNPKCLNGQTIANTLISIALNIPEINSMLFEMCITELEDICTSRHFFRKFPKPILQETSHPYIDDITLDGHVQIPNAISLRIEFDQQCSTEKRNDPLVIMDSTGRVIATRSGREYAQWAPEIRITGDEMRWKFTSDSSVNGWGWRFWVHGVMPASFLLDTGSDHAILCRPSMPLVMGLLDSVLEPSHQSILLRLASSLTSCIQLNTLSTVQRIWATQKLHYILRLKIAPKPLDGLLAFLSPIMPALLRQYEYEEPLVRTGLYLMHSDYFKNLASLACDMQLDNWIQPSMNHKWAWFKRYCTAVRVAQSIIKRTEVPETFCIEVREKLADMCPTALNIQRPIMDESMITSANEARILSSSSIHESTKGSDPNTSQMLNSISTQSNDDQLSRSGGKQIHTHEDHNIFKAQHDRQLLQWINQRPEDWTLSWGGASTIYGWGHNHRGQLGGLEGGRIKSPTPCESLSLLRPTFICGGEQTLYAITPDGKLYATGYGAGGRLGIGGTDSVSTPTLIESLQHIFVRKVAVNSGGKHCLALSGEGEVYSWGEGEDGKLGHNNRLNCDRPKLITALSGIGVTDIACGSAHSACITSAGHILTWGKGRYGRLGHGDSEDQLRPKLVEALLGYRVVDIACGSGDAQTVCITDDDNVWSFGDGDYGKLGRGGSEGCKIPMKIESLAGLGVIKVECGSQFSVALTRSGSVYTWGKGDYHRLGHGSVDHVRRPKKVAALQGKKIISIATGSLHCVACSDSGDVFTWGDNDEGQLGDGTVSAIQRPRLVSSLQGKHIIKVTCGSAHTIALSTSDVSENSRPPPITPLEYDFIRDLTSDSLLGRLVFLHHFSELICPCLPLLPTSGEVSLDALKNILVYSIKETFFRKIIQTTMVRDKQHGPVFELNRIQVKRARSKIYGGLAGIDGMKSVFGQMVQKLPLLNQESLYLPHRVWKVKFVGESVDDCGGGFSESIAEMCDELQNGAAGLLIQTPNGRGEAGANRDCFLLDPTLHTILQMNMFRFLGVLMGIAIRTGSPLSLNLAEPVWRQLTGETLRPSDLTEVDRDYVASLICIRDMDNDPKLFESLDLPFTTPSAKGHEVQLSTRYTRVTPMNKKEYVRLALNYRLHEFDEQVKAVRDGMSKVVPVPLLALFSAAQLQTLVCGSPEIPLDLLKSVASYKGIDATSSLVQWFWEVMEEFSNQERSLFLRFVWGRTRLPRTIADFRGRDFVLQVLDKYQPPDYFLPESYTCFFLLKMPRYTSKLILAEKLKYAIYFCKSIDTDEYARVALAEQTDQTASENHSDIGSEVSEDL